MPHSTCVVRSVCVAKVRTNFLSRSSFYSADSIFGNIFVQTFFMYNSSAKMRQTPSLSKLTIWALALTPNLQSFAITSPTFSGLLAVADVSGRAGWSSLFHTLLFFKNACTRHTNFTISLTHSLKIFNRGFPKFDEKLDVNFLLIFESDFSDRAQQHICT